MMDTGVDNGPRITPPLLRQKQTAAFLGEAAVSKSWLLRPCCCFIFTFVLNHFGAEQSWESLGDQEAVKNKSRNTL